MSLRINITPGKLPTALREREAATKRAIQAGIRSGAERGRGILVNETPVDQGQLRASWKVRRAVAGLEAILLNDAPHAGVIEAGARPHPVSAAGREAIANWAWRNRRTLGIQTREDAVRVAWAIAAKIRREGQVGQFFVRKSLPAVGRALVHEVDRMLRRLANKRTSGDG